MEQTGFFKNWFYKVNFSNVFCYGLGDDCFHTKGKI